MPTLISNENYAIRWDKTDCDQYTITNLSDQYNAHVTVTDETGTYTETFDLGPSGTNTIVLPGDGVFKLCAYLFDIPLEIEDIVYENTYLSICTIDIDDASIVDLAKAILVDRSVDPPATTTIFQSGDFSNPPTSYSLFLADLQSFVTLNGGGTVTILEPGDSLPDVPPNINAYQIVIKSNSVILESVGVIFPPGLVISEIASDMYCVQLEYTFDPNKPYISSFELANTQLVPTGEFWDMSTAAGALEAETAINTFLGINGYAIANILSLKVFRQILSSKTNCKDVEFTIFKLGPGETQCDYIYEFCDLYACLSRLMNRWLCQDPCADKCTTAGESYEEARRKAVELSTMFFHALMPLVTTDRLWYLGNWDISDQRLCNVNNILELYKKMRDYVKNCGFDCGCGCPDNCGDCQPCNGYSYAPSPSNPSTPCGCK
jgi:hypothetical protein